MFKSLKSVTYHVPDLEKATQWYGKILNRQPVLDSPLAVMFELGDFGLTLKPITKPAPSSKERIVAYWEVDDIDAAHRQLLASGATPHTEITPLLHSRMAKVIDPFGNIIGITCKISGKKKTLADQPSDTAMTAAFCRALASKDESEEIRGPDYLAEIFLREDGRKPLHDPAAREWVMQKFISPGTYEFFLARTAYLDQMVQNALRENIPQIVFLGAGYDTRAYRFAAQIKQTRIFELDIASTQQRKRLLLQQARVPIPAQLAFVAINFEKDTLGEVLFQAGFERNKHTLFIGEGVTYYLSARAVDETLAFVRSHAPAGSTICFDYMLEAPDMSNRYGVKAAQDAMRTMYAAESVQFGIAEGTIEPYLSGRGFKLIEHLTPEDMERKYLTLRSGSLAGKVLALFCFARAIVMN